jgi:RNA-directed DNA polymerase
LRETPIVRHVKVQGGRSPFDGDLIYWGSRLGRHPELSREITILLKKQQGKCSHCGLVFRDEDLLEIDHIIPNSLGGNNSISNI